ncbi:MAG TPA: glycosyltransferase [Candidatus Binataceae bacterium]|nr:glycosyltransferase [Candidatus Binataceae bacterium]
MSGSIRNATEDLTIVIANLGNVTHLQNCLKSLFVSLGSEIRVRVIVGYNFAGVSEGPEQIALEFPQVEQFRAKAKLGYCRAYNQLMAMTTSRYVLLLDDDSLLRKGTVEGMVRFMDEHREVGIATCRTVNPDGSYQKTTAKMYNLRTEIANICRPSAFWRDGIDETVQTWRPAGWLNGNFLIVRSQTLRDVGPLDEHYYTFQCEADWCLRIKAAGWVVAYVPNFEVIHIGGAHSVESKVKSYNNLIRSHINRYYFIRKHYGNTALLIFRAIMSLGAAFRFCTYGILAAVKPSRRDEAIPKLKAYWKVFLLGMATQPDSLPPDLLRDSEVFEPFLRVGDAKADPTSVG